MRIPIDIDFRYPNIDFLNSHQWIDTLDCNEMFHYFYNTLQTHNHENLEQDLFFTALIIHNQWQTIESLLIFQPANKRQWLGAIAEIIFTQPSIKDCITSCEHFLDMIHAKKNSNIISYIDVYVAIFIACIKRHKEFSNNPSTNFNLPIFDNTLSIFDGLFADRFQHEEIKTFINSDFFMLELLKYSDEKIFQYFKDKGTDFLSYHYNFKGTLSDLSIYSILSEHLLIKPKQAIVVTHFLMKQNISLKEDNYSSFMKFISKNYFSYVHEFIEHVEFNHPKIKQKYNNLILNQQFNIKLNEAEHVFLKYFNYYHLENTINSSDKKTKIKI